MFLPRFLAGFVFSIAMIGCKSAPKPVPAVLPVEPGLGACMTEIRGPNTHGTIRAVHDSTSIHEVVDLDGNGQPEEVRVSKLDRETRVVQVERFGPDGATLLSRETRTWDGRRLQRREIDSWAADGSPGPDGAADETVALVWLGDRLQTEAVDQLDAGGLLGVDGTPERLTTWTYDETGGAVGTQVDTADNTVLRVDRLTLDGDRLVRRAIDLGGDGEVDIAIVNTWRGGRVVSQRIEGALETADITFEYCR